MIDRMQQHYGFTVMPFTAAIPVPALFGSAAHKEAVARLRWLISAGWESSRAKSAPGRRRPSAPRPAAWTRPGTP
jgi:hypothetical protein